MAVLLLTITLASNTALAQPIHSTPAVRPAGPATRPYLHQPGSFYRYGVPSSIPPRYLVNPVSPLPTSDALPPLAGTQTTSATIHVLAEDGATVTIDGLKGETAGLKHTFTTKPIPGGAELRVSVTVTSPTGAATLTMRVRGGDRATIDMR